MDMILEAIVAVAMVLGSLLVTSLLCGLVWGGCSRFGRPHISALALAGMAAGAFLLNPHGRFLPLVLAYCAAAVPILWIAGRISMNAKRKGDDQNPLKKMTTKIGI